jgi:hypothetical protein
LQKNIICHRTTISQENSKKGKRITIEVALDKKIIKMGDGIALGKILALAQKKRV